MTSKPRVVRVRQGTPAWHDFRATHIGSSDAPVIVGESPYRSALDLYVERTTSAAEPDAFTARLFRIGHAMEPVILALYAEETGAKVRKGRVLEDRMVPWLSASLDGETADGTIVEAKWTSSSRWRDGVPADVLVQVTHQMAVARVPRATWRCSRRATSRSTGCHSTPRSGAASSRWKRGSWKTT